MKSYKDLEVYQLAYDLCVEVHRMSLSLPKYELYEMGSQIRRSSKSVLFNLVEGFGRKKYKKEFIRFLTFAHASNDEVICQLRLISDLHIHDKSIDCLLHSYDQLGKKIYAFMRYVEREWRSKS